METYFSGAELRWPTRLRQEEYNPGRNSKMLFNEAAANEKATSALCRTWNL